MQIDHVPFLFFFFSVERRSRCKSTTLLFLPRAKIAVQINSRLRVCFRSSSNENRHVNRSNTFAFYLFLSRMKISLGIDFACLFHFFLFSLKVEKTSMQIAPRFHLLLLFFRGTISARIDDVCFFSSFKGTSRLKFTPFTFSFQTTIPVQIDPICFFSSPEGGTRCKLTSFAFFIRAEIPTEINSRLDFLLSLSSNKTLG